MNYSRFINSFSSCRQQSPIRELTKILAFAPPNTISFAGGLPNCKLFPFKNAIIELKDGTTLNLNEQSLDIALQYGPSDGYPVFQKQLLEMQKLLHKPPLWSDKQEENLYNLLITNGSQDALCKTFEMLLNEGDYVITEEPAYPGFLAILQPFKPKYIPIQSDSEGMNVEQLRKSLARWTPDQCHDSTSGVPKVIYIVPNGGNPSGATLSQFRRKEIYKIAQDYNLIIIEDDPYYFLQFDGVVNPSFLSMDVDGRVMRFDSFSKVFSGGMRIGFVTAPKALLASVLNHIQCSVMHASMLSQMVISRLLTQWGHEGFMNHVSQVQSFYRNQRDMMIKYATKWIGDIAEWNVPVAGMFIWIKVPGLSDTNPMVMKKAIEKGVLLVPGNYFMVDGGKSNCFRAAFSLASEKQMDEGFRKLSDLIREEMSIQK